MKKQKQRNELLNSEMADKIRELLESQGIDVTDDVVIAGVIFAEVAVSTVEDNYVLETKTVFKRVTGVKA